MNYDLLKKNFEKHGFQTSYFQTKEEASTYMAEKIKGKTVAFGGSMTLKDMKLDQILSQDNQVIWHWNEPGRSTTLRAREASVYISSANGVSETGELVNIDGTGNRVSMTVYGPEKVYFVVGSNKIEPDLPSAVSRAKNVAAPKNAIRCQVKTPCVANGGDRCYDCNSPDRICRGTLITERPSVGMEIEVVFIDEELGY